MITRGRYLLSYFLTVVYNMIVQMVQVVFNIFMLVVGCSSKHCYVFHSSAQLTHSMSLQCDTQNSPYCRVAGM